MGSRAEVIKFWKCQTFGGEEWKYAFNIKRLTLNVMSSVVEPEPDFLAGAGASEKAPAPGCCCLA